MGATIFFFPRVAGKYTKGFPLGNPWCFNVLDILAFQAPRNVYTPETEKNATVETEKFRLRDVLHWALPAAAPGAS